jgi:hypothetical protein
MAWLVRVFVIAIPILNKIFFDFLMRTSPLAACTDLIRADEENVL